MSCDEHHGAISALLDDELSPEEGRALEEHLADCAACADERAALAQVAGQVRGLPRLSAPPHFRAQVMSGALAAAAPDGFDGAVGLGGAGGAIGAAGEGVGDGWDADAVTSAGRGDAAVGAPPAAGLEPAPAAQGPAAPPDPLAWPESAPVVPSPRAGAAASPCAALATDLSADLDEALAPDARARLGEHLAACAACRGERDDLERVRATVRGLPRLGVPAAFRARLLAAIDLEDEAARQRALDARRSRIQWWGRFGWAARAACLLLMAGGGMALTSPRVSSWSAPTYAWEHARAHVGGDRPGAAPRPAPPEPARPTELRSVAEAAPGPYDATWELEVSSLDEAAQLARSVLTRHGFQPPPAPRGRAQPRPGAPRQTGRQTGGPIEAEVRGEVELDLVAAVPANLVDDVHEELERASAVETNRESWASLRRIHQEHDRVVRKNGFVMVGELVAASDPRARGARPGQVLLRAGDAVYTLDPGDIERIERADAVRRVRVVLRQRD